MADRRSVTFGEKDELNVGGEDQEKPVEEQQDGLKSPKKSILKAPTGPLEEVGTLSKQVSAASKGSTNTGSINITTSEEGDDAKDELTGSKAAASDSDAPEAEDAAAEGAVVAASDMAASGESDEKVQVHEIVGEDDGDPDAPPRTQKQQYYTWDMKLTIVQAKNLRAADFGGTSDPFVKFHVSSRPHEKFVTDTIENSINPSWNYIQRLDELEMDDLIVFDIYDEDVAIAGMDHDGEHLGKTEVKMTQKLMDDGYRGELILQETGHDVHAVLVVYVDVVAQHTHFRNAVIDRWGVLISITSAANLKNADMFGLSDPYCLVKLKNKSGLVKHTFRTETVEDDLNPEWHYEHFVLSASIMSPNGNGILLGDYWDFEVHDADEESTLKGDDLLGHFVVKTEDYFPSGFATEEGKLEGVSADHGSTLCFGIEVLNKIRCQSYEEYMAAAEAEKKEAEMHAARAAEEARALAELNNPFGYKPEPLHVRAMVRAEIRRVVMLVPEANAELREAESTDGVEDDPDLEAEVKRLRYRVGLLETRLKRLRDLDPRTFRQMPMQCVAAARDGDAEYVQFCTDAGVDPDVQDYSGVTPLIAASVANKVSVVRALLEAKADPRIQDNNGATGAHYAVLLDHIHVCTALLDTECFDAFTVKDHRDMSAVDYARRDDREVYLRYIRSRMGGPTRLLTHIFKGWVLDVTGLPRQQKAWEEMFACKCDVIMAEKAAPMIEYCTSVEMTEEEKEAIKANKKQAIADRKAALKALNAKAGGTPTSATSTPTGAKAKAKSIRTQLSKA